MNDRIVLFNRMKNQSINQLDILDEFSFIKTTTNVDFRNEKYTVTTPLLYLNPQEKKYPLVVRVRKTNSTKWAYKTFFYEINNLNLGTFARDSSSGIALIQLRNEDNTSTISDYQKNTPYDKIKVQLRGGLIENTNQNLKRYRLSSQYFNFYSSDGSTLYNTNTKIFSEFEIFQIEYKNNSYDNGTDDLIASITVNLYDSFIEDNVLDRTTYPDLVSSNLARVDIQVQIKQNLPIPTIDFTNLTFADQFGNIRFFESGYGANGLIEPLDYLTYLNNYVITNSTVNDYNWYVEVNDNKLVNTDIINLSSSNNSDFYYNSQNIKCSPSLSSSLTISFKELSNLISVDSETNTFSFDFNKIGTNITTTIFNPQSPSVSVNTNNKFEVPIKIKVVAFNKVDNTIKAEKEFIIYIIDYLKDNEPKNLNYPVPYIKPYTLNSTIGSSLSSISYPSTNQNYYQENVRGIVLSDISNNDINISNLKYHLGFELKYLNTSMNLPSSSDNRFYLRILSDDNFVVDLYKIDHLNGVLNYNLDINSNNNVVNNTGRVGYKLKNNSDVVYFEPLDNNIYLSNVTKKQNSQTTQANEVIYELNTNTLYGNKFVAISKFTQKGLTNQTDKFFTGIAVINEKVVDITNFPKRTKIDEFLVINTNYLQKVTNAKIYASYQTYNEHNGDDGNIFLANDINDVILDFDYNSLNEDINYGDKLVKVKLDIISGGTITAFKQKDATSFSTDLTANDFQNNCYSIKVNINNSGSLKTKLTLNYAYNNKEFVFYKDYNFSSSLQIYPKYLEITNFSSKIKQPSGNTSISGNLPSSSTSDTILLDNEALFAYVFEIDAVVDIYETSLKVNTEPSSLTWNFEPYSEDGYLPPLTNIIVNSMENLSFDSVNEVNRYRFNLTIRALTPDPGQRWENYHDSPINYLFKASCQLNSIVSNEAKFIYQGYFRGFLFESIEEPFVYAKKRIKGNYIEIQGIDNNDLSSLKYYRKINTESNYDRDENLAFYMFGIDSVYNPNFSEKFLVLKNLSKVDTVDFESLDYSGITISGFDNDAYTNDVDASSQLIKNPCSISKSYNENSMLVGIEANDFINRKELILSTVGTNFNLTMYSSTFNIVIDLSQIQEFSDFFSKISLITKSQQIQTGFYHMPIENVKINFDDNMFIFHNDYFQESLIIPPIRLVPRPAKYGIDDALDSMHFVRTISDVNGTNIQQGNSLDGLSMYINTANIIIPSKTYRNTISNDFIGMSPGSITQMNINISNDNDLLYMTQYDGFLFDSCEVFFGKVDTVNGTFSITRDITSFVSEDYLIKAKDYNLQKITSSTHIENYYTTNKYGKYISHPNYLDEYLREGNNSSNFRRFRVGKQSSSTSISNENAFLVPIPNTTFINTYKQYGENVIIYKLDVYGLNNSVPNISAVGYSADARSKYTLYIISSQL